MKKSPTNPTTHPQILGNQPVFAQQRRCSSSISFTIFSTSDLGYVHEASKGLTFGKCLEMFGPYTHLLTIFFHIFSLYIIFFFLFSFFLSFSLCGSPWRNLSVQCNSSRAVSFQCIKLHEVVQRPS